MIFDLLCSIVERHWVEFRPILEKAKLFVFGGAAKDFLPKQQGENLEFLRDMMMLPFPVVALEDVSSCVLLMDMEKNQRGCSGRRMFVDCLPFNAPPESFREIDDPRYKTVFEEFREANDLAPPGTIVLSCGTMSITKLETRTFETDGIVDWQIVCNKDRIFIDPVVSRAIFTEAARRAALINALTAMEEVMFLYSPSQWIIEEIPSFRPTHNSKILRSHQRSKFISLPRAQARAKLQLPEDVKGKHKSPEAHERRAHPRTYKADRFIRMKGKTVMIAATWVGPTEVKIGKKVYKVRIDLWEKVTKHFEGSRKD